ncbi:MAG TPA: Xaa-Pro peptidase family protein [Gemmatimonadaceae bacterium]|nr:Xaa-Pro peptidase family protein [Gemmatimonadaceae bacterium]
MLSPERLPALQRALADAKLDGWLLYDFHGVNPIANGLLALEGMVSRRIFVFIPREGAPRALGHAIENGPWRLWPAEWPRGSYSSWKQLEAAVSEMVRGKRIAMEYSPGDAVPYLDRVPAGVLEMVRAAGATDVVSSGELVTRFYASWSAEHLASHLRSAETIRTIAYDAFALAGERSRTRQPVMEHELVQWMQERFARAGLITDHGPSVCAGANSANPHYEASADRPVPIRDGDVLLIDLWATEPGEVYADQTWMATLGPPSARAQEIWSIVRDARDAAIRLVQDSAAQGEPLRGADVDDAARAVITARGYGDRFIHRTGHSIDPRSLHGSGPHLDNLETREERLLVPGIGFSIEPGLYIPGEIGMRSEVNAFLEPGRALITPSEYQRELIVV